MSVFSCQLPLPLMDLPAGAGFIAFASSTGSFLLWIIAFVGTTHLLSTICCNKKKKEATKESTTPNITVQEPTANNGNQQRSSEATKNSMPLKNDEKKESDPTKTAKSIRASDNNKKNSKNRSSNSGKIKRAVSSNYPQPSISINSRTTDKSIIIPKEQEEKVPKGSAAGNIDEQIRKKSQGELADGLDLLHHFDRPSQKDKVRKDMSKDVKIVDQENMLYITDDASNTEDSSTVSVKASPAANGGKEPMDNLKYAQQVHLEATLTGGKVMEERKSRAAGEKREQNPKNAQGSDYAFKM